MAKITVIQPTVTQSIDQQDKLVAPSNFNDPIYNKKDYRRWRIRILYSIILGYATFYFCRQNFNIAMPALMDEFGVSRTQLGWVLTWASVVYGIGKSLNGFISDKSNARYFMPLGLAVSALITLCAGFSSSILAISLLWILNNWFQSMGWPPVARMLTHWFAPKELGTKWALGATSHQVGGALTMGLCGYLVEQYGWQAAFYVPGVIALGVALFLLNRLRDSPKDVHLPAVEQYKGDCLKKLEKETHLTSSELLRRVFFNKLMWCVCMANMCLYIVRLGVIFWAPLFLRELKGMSLSQAGWQVASYELLGLGGGLFAGWMSDKVFQGRRGPVGVLFMIALALTLILFWKMPENYTFLSMLMLTLVGFFVYGPQVLVGVASADFATKRAIGTANGFASCFAYLGSAMAGVNVGWIVDHYSWDGVFLFFVFAALLGAFFFSLIWKHSANGKHVRKTKS